MADSTESSYPNSEVFGWIFDYACSMAWYEFKKNHTVDSLSGRSFMTGVIDYTTDEVAERVDRVGFIHLLCLLADSHQPTLKYTKDGDEEGGVHRSPLEVAVETVGKMEGRMEEGNPLKKEVQKMTLLLKAQAVLAWLREENKAAAKKLLSQFWPRKASKVDGEAELVKNLSDAVGGKTKASFDEAHSRESFLGAVLPTLGKIHAQFKEPFLVQVLNRKKDQSKEVKSSRDVIPHSHLKKLCGSKSWAKAMKITEDMVDSDSGTELSEKAFSPPTTTARQSSSRDRGSSSSTKAKTASTAKRQSRQRDQAQSSVSSSDGDEESAQSAHSPAKRVSSSDGDEESAQSSHSPAKRVSSWDGDEESAQSSHSPAKRGRSIRTMKYGKAAKTRTQSEGPGERVAWNGDNDQDEESPVRRKIKLHSPHVRKSLRGISPNKKRPVLKAAKRRPWSEEETELLRKGVARYGTGKWSEILLTFQFDRRTNVDLKDRYRTLVKKGLM